MTGVDAGADRQARSQAEAESVLLADVSDVLRGERTLWRATERIVSLAAPHVDAVCLGVPLTAGFNVDIVSRTVVRRAHDALAAITAAVDSPARASARVHLRAMAEDLFFMKWLIGLDEAVATEYVRQRARVEALQAIKAQQDFLPLAYKQLNVDSPDLGFGDFSDALTQARDELAELCQAQGWGRRGPSVKKMDESGDLLHEYEFFYHLSSKSVHANLHEMARMTWGTDHAVNISSNPFEGVHADLANVYGTWLFDKILEAVADRFEPLQTLMGCQAYGVWLALILVGAASQGRLPLMIHPEELRIR
ncbi:DUF5677 domain-containing protein [Streptomyces sp. NPDC093544]|uniref:DUF5677 domain-containing protein n=1 Tax=Streptomyces sp. NPDC093544 TaxID=3155200 RepID=UPI003446010C